MNVYKVQIDKTPKTITQIYSCLQNFKNVLLQLNPNIQITTSVDDQTLIIETTASTEELLYGVICAF